MSQIGFESDHSYHFYMARKNSTSPVRLRASDLNLDLRAYLMRRKLVVLVSEQWPRLQDETKAQLITRDNLLMVDYREGMSPEAVLTVELSKLDQLIKDETDKTLSAVREAIDKGRVTDFVRVTAQKMNQVQRSSYADSASDPADLMGIWKILDVLRDDARKRKLTAEQVLLDEKLWKASGERIRAREIMLIPNRFVRGLNNLLRRLTGRPVFPVPIINDRHRRQVADGVEVDQLQHMFDTPDTSKVGDQIREAEQDLDAVSRQTREFGEEIKSSGIKALMETALINPDALPGLLAQSLPSSPELG